MVHYSEAFFLVFFCFPSIAARPSCEARRGSNLIADEAPLSNLTDAKAAFANSRSSLGLFDGLISRAIVRAGCD